MGAIFTRIRSALWGEEYRARLIREDGTGIELFTVVPTMKAESWPKVDFSRRGKDGYEGSYSVLAAFLEGCKESGMPHSDYRQLVAALLDLSKKTGKTKINTADGHFADVGEETSAYLLSSLGIATIFGSSSNSFNNNKRMSSRPHMTQDMMLELFKERIMEDGHLMHKTQAACIRPAIQGERVVTMIGGRVTSEVVVENHTSWVVRAPTTHQEEYVLTNDKFEVNWLYDEPEDLSATSSELAEQGFKRYLPRPGIMKWMYQIKKEDIDIMPSQVFKASWGALQPIILDDYLAMPYPEVKASEIYLMPADAVDSSYSKVDKNVGAKNEENQTTIPMLRTLLFDWSKRGNIQLDTDALICGFTEPFNLLYRYQIVATVFAEWIAAIAEQYRLNPYHDWKHAFDVFQFTYGAFTEGGGHKYFHYQDLLVLLLSAIAHDVGHLGYTNAFLINSHADLAITYNDKSPLESMHASVFFQTLRKPGLNFMSNVGKDNFKTFRSKVVDAILATDMSHHFQMVDTFSVRVSQAKQGSPFVEGSDVVDREAADQTLLLQAFMHMADVGHCCRPFEIHKFLVARLEEEFFRQGDQERELGLPIMPMMDRTKDSAASGQSFFLNKLVLPLLKPYTFFLSEQRAQSLLDNIAANSTSWERWVEKHGKSKSAQEMLQLEGFEFQPTKSVKKPLRIDTTPSMDKEGTVSPRRMSPSKDTTSPQSAKHTRLQHHEQSERMANAASGGAGLNKW